MLEYLKTGADTYDDVIRHLVLLHPQQLTMAELYRRWRQPGRPIRELVEKSRRQPF